MGCASVPVADHRCAEDLIGFASRIRRILAMLRVSYLFMAVWLSVTCSSCSRGYREPAPEPPAPKQTAPKRAPLKLWLGGDVHIGTELTRLTEGVALEGAMGIVNLEGPIAPGLSAEINSAGVRLRNAVGTPGILRAAGVGVVGLANNHRLDDGIAGLESTRRALQSAGISPVGGSTRIIEHASWKLALVARELGNTSDRKIAESVRVVVNSSDVVIVSMHVTGPPSYLPSEPLVAVVDSVVSAGGDIVVVHGSHAVAKVERRADALIVWGLGNLVFSCDCTREQDALLLLLSVTKTAGTLRIGAELLPLQAGLNGQPARPAADPHVLMGLLKSLGSSTLTPSGAAFSF